jgi:hypothetical protein
VIITNVRDLTLALLDCPAVQACPTLAELERLLISSGLIQDGRVYANGRWHDVVVFDRRKLETLLGRAIDPVAMGLAPLPPQPPEVSG